MKANLITDFHGCYVTCVLTRQAANQMQARIQRRTSVSGQLDDKVDKVLGTLCFSRTAFTTDETALILFQQPHIANRRLRDAVHVWIPSTVVQ